LLRLEETEIDVGARWEFFASDAGADRGGGIVIDLGTGAPLWPLAVVAVVGCLLAVGVIVWLTVRSRRH
jgi:hypothetical protein